MLRLRHLLIPILLAGCASSGPEPSPAPAAPVLPPEIHWVRNSAEYRALLVQTFGLARERLEEAVAGREAGSWAVALDADETLISNSLYQKEVFEKGESFSRESWYAWAGRREAAALPGAREFLERVRELGGKIAIVTNRDEAICEPTEANLRALELPYDVILCRRGESRKEPRWESLRKGTAAPGLPPVEIVMWLGDNIQDFPDWDQERGSGRLETFEDFGRKFFVLPNPMYGSWVRNARE